MLKDIFTNVMTESDDKTRWFMAYALFALSEVLAVIHAYQSLGHSVLGYLSFGLPLLVFVPIFSARTALKVFNRNPAIQSDSALRLDISMRLFTLVVFSYGLFIFTIEVAGTK
jgi:hypothetical protein